MDLAIETRGLSRRYGTRVAVDALDLAVPAGRVTGFVGPNGAGKTTTIRMLLGLIRPDAGAALILGRPVARDPAVLRHVGALVDGPAFYPGLSGRDNLRVLARIGRLRPATVDRALEIVALTDRADDRVSAYSLGMRQRLGIAAALLPSPAVVILDEPTNGLDPAGIHDTRRLLRELARDGATVFVSSHQLAELEQVCDHLVLLRAGRLAYQGPMAELLDRQMSRLVGRPESPHDARALAANVRVAGYEAVVEDGSVIVTAPGSWAGQFNRLAHASGITLVELQIRAPTLEETFLALTAASAPEGLELIVGAIRAELLKLRELTYLAGVVGVAGLAAVTMIISVGNAGDVAEDRGPAGLILTRAELAAHDGLARVMGNSVTFVGIALLTLTAINVAAEYQRGTVRNLLVRQPRRVTVVMAKAIALLGFTVLVALVSAASGTVTATAMAPAAAVDTAAWTTTEGLTATVGATASLAVALGGWTAMGLVLATITRSAAPAIGIGVGYALALEIILTVAAGSVARWLPGQLLQTVARGGSASMPYETALLASLGWIVACGSVAGAVFRRRDVTS